MINPFSFFTFYLIVLLFFLRYFGIEQQHLYLVCIVILANSIHGSYLINMHIKDASHHYNVAPFLIYLCDFLTHWVFGIYALHLLSLGANLSLGGLILNFIIILSSIAIYLYHFVPSIVYKFTNMTSSHLMINHFIIVCIIVIFMILLNKIRMF